MWRILVLVLLLNSCVLPATKPGASGFVSTTELASVSALREAHALFNKGKYIDSEMRLRVVAYRYPEAKNIRLSLATVLTRTGNLIEAEALLKGLMSEGYSEGEVLEALADLSIVRHDLKGAEQYYNQGIERALKRKEYLKASKLMRLTSRLMFRYGYEIEARCYSDLALSYAGTSVGEIQLHVELLTAIGLLAQSKSTIEHGITQQELYKNSQILGQLGVITFAAGDYPAARKLLELAVRPSSTVNSNISALTHLERIAAKLGSEDEVEPEEELDDEFIVTPYLSLYWPPTVLDQLTSVVR